MGLRWHTASQTDLAGEAGMSECLYNIGVAQILSQGDFHWGPVRSALYILVLLWCYDLHNHTAYLSLLYEMQDSQLGC